MWRRGRPARKSTLKWAAALTLATRRAGRLGIRVRGENGNYFPHTLNNTVVAPPRMLIAFLENNLQADGSIAIPAALRAYMGGQERIG